MNDVADILLKIAVTIILAILTKYVIPIFRTFYEDARWQKLINMVQAAVEAAEQTIRGEGQGQIKKEDVRMFITTWLNTNDISVSESEIDRLIEAAVYKMNAKKKPK